MAEAARAAAGRRDSIRKTLLIYLGALSLIGAALLFLAARSYGRAAADRSYDHLLISSALSIADSVALVDGQWQVDLPYAALDLLAMAPEDRVYYRVSSREGPTITGYADLPAPPSLPRDGQPRLFDAMYRGENTRFVAVSRWVAGPASQGQAIVQVGQTRRAREALADDMVLRALVAIVVLSLAALALVWIGVYRALRPLQRLERDLSERESSDLRPVGIDVPTELDQTVESLNRFMARLSASNETLRAFMGEAAHQMRTPLAALRAQAQLALDEDDPAEQRRSLETIERNASHMSRLLNQLLSDASAIHRGNLQQFETVEMAELLHQAIYEAVPQSGPRPDLHLAATSEPLRVRGDALLLREAIKNLIDNALKHGRAPLQIALTASAENVAPLAVLTIADHGPGIAPADAQTVFERFARGRDAAAGGAGLGLAIVKRIVESHGGTIDLSNRVGGGLVVTLRLPRELT
ncbi:sensor histidine kinase N-terminal domain-containing protein [Lysobacter sp. K5869]|uniref:sensor histidine kinase n=1 Tax=Lysobacter sp. K5869 TaxID=2820808 RepID=UPI001C064900|nr:sensor histidine kinase [Lysobacter sp. K5869]QWP78104.1 sensor histidine kinase N-terminal domain-containing protein [Lysobacter sp. K5869]